MKDSDRQKIYKFLSSQDFCVISTVNNKSLPEAAYVAFMANEKLELVIGTSRQSRKVANLKSKNAVAIALADLKIGVQYEGQAKTIDLNGYEKLVKSGKFQKLPGSEKYRSDSDQVWLYIFPSWIRFTTHGKPDKIEEFTEFNQ